jgi:GH15 family glucan-1,4-alpha-glucosidase
MSYQPIESYGVIGNMRSAALVGKNGSIDWCCLPNFDSPSVFAALLDDRKGGSFRISATEPDATCRQMYLPDTNVLVTRFHAGGGTGDLTDFMPLPDPKRPRAPVHRIVRIVRSVRAEMRFRLECRPAFDYARQPHRAVRTERGVVFESSAGRLLLSSPYDLQIDGPAAVADFKLSPRETAVFVLTWIENDSDQEELDPRNIEEEVLLDTIRFWKNWIAKCRYHGRWREIVYRSALALKLMTFEPTGAIVAAPTCSLPEEIGGGRNWDYRYTWIRDAAFTVYAFLRLGYYSEASSFMAWLQKTSTTPGPCGPLQVMYRIDGSPNLSEYELHHLEGYRGSSPVRVGNAARDQLQLDIYGELLDAIYLYNKYAGPISYDFWNYLLQILIWLCDNWERPDFGIWERRMQPQQLVSSKVQCWVALDRGLRIADKRRLPVPHERLRRECDRIYEAVMHDGWNSETKTFVQSFGSQAVDASSLLMPLMLFVSPTDPRMLHTLDQISQRLVSDTLVYRYHLGDGSSDGLAGTEGTFSMCSFWLSEVMCRAGRVEEGRLIFEKMLTYGNHLGLYAEEIGAGGEALGNFPQAFTHLALISAAWRIDRELGGRP